MRLKALPFVVSLVCIGIGGAASVQALSIDSDLGQSWQDFKVPNSMEEGAPSSLAESAAKLISSESIVAMKLVKEKGNKRILLESSSFRRGAGVVHGKGLFWDGGGPRKIRMFVDAYGDGRLPVASFPFDFESTGGRQPIAVSIKDYSHFKRFAFRFTHDGITLDLASSEDDSIEVSGVLPNALLFHSDYGELRKLLEMKGYIVAESFEPDAMFGAVRRFRSDHDLPGPGFITIGDLFALRIVNNISSGETSLVPYVEWSSGAGGGRMEPREEFVETNPDSELKKDMPAETSGINIYDEIEPPAEDDNA